MKPPRKHHFVPAFYLRRWCQPNGRLCEFKHVRNKVVPRRTYPEATGYLNDLYKIEGLPEELAQHIESKFMHMVDTWADEALRLLESGEVNKFDDRLRSAWVRFILSLRFRNPEAVQLIRTQMLRLWQAANENLRKNYSTWRRVTDPETAEEYIALMDPNAHHKEALMLLSEIIDNEKVAPTILSMNWAQLSLNNAKHSLLTSDRAIIMPLGLGRPNGHLILPIGPSKVFVAAHEQTVIDRLQSQHPDTFVQAINDHVARQARKLVWGPDDRQLRFVSNRIARPPDHVIMTDAQMQEAIAVASGISPSRETTEL